nr:DUF296 domain-containing protein [Kofleriaceae bacterium]
MRWLKPNEVAPHGHAPGAKHRLVSSLSDGSKVYALVLAEGDDVPTALLELAKTESIHAAHFVAIGGVRGPEVGWFDPQRHEFKAMQLAEQAEVLTLSGDIAIGADNAAVVHAHAVFGLSDGTAWGGHVIGAAASPTLEVFVTTYPTALYKRPRPDGIQLIDPGMDSPMSH